ncbi:MAG: enoyl-[acyl-carrier-protein] reductase FabK [Thermovirga sp.]|nr:enoyl-[acyl-carrier-protein] reductase FabK [Thermovirga sp.]
MFGNNRITRLLEINYPVLQGGMAWVADADLAAAVSNGGGLGVIAAGSMPPDLLESQIAKVRTLTAKPFGVNIMLLSATADAALEVVERNRVPVVTTGAGAPGKVIERLKPQGTKVIPVIASVAQAKRVEKQGADAVIAEGMEAGGHIGEITTMVLVPQIVDAVKIPVVAAGGVAEPRGVLAAFSLGAEGVQVGTRFVCASESNAHSAFKDEILKARDRSTAITGASTGHPVRCIQNRLTREFAKLEKAGASLEELEKLGTGRLRAAVVDGDVDYGSVMAGQSAALVNKVQPAAEIIRELFDGTQEMFESLHRFSNQ